MLAGNTQALELHLLDVDYAMALFLYASCCRIFFCNSPVFFLKNEPVPTVIDKIVAVQ